MIIVWNKWWVIFLVTHFVFSATGYRCLLSEFIYYPLKHFPTLSPRWIQVSTVENSIPRGENVVYHRKSQLPTFCCSFVSLFSIYCKFFRDSQPKNSIHDGGLFPHLSFFSFTSSFSLFMAFFCQALPKSALFYQFQTFSPRGIQFSTLVRPIFHGRNAFHHLKRLFYQRKCWSATFYSKTISIKPPFPTKKLCNLFH